MNPNFDFRSDEIWDDRSIDFSVGDALPEILDFLGLCFCLVVIAFGVTL